MVSTNDHNVHRPRFQWLGHLDKDLKRWPVEHRITAKLSNQNHTMIAEEVRYSLTVPGMDTLYVLNAMRQMICSVMHFVCTLTVRTL